MEIRRLGAGDVEAYRTIRLRSVREDPEAFMASYEEESARTVEQDRERLAASEASDDNFVFAAFEDGQPVGITGVLRLFGHRSKGRHKAMIWGVYVAPEMRGRGIGRALMETAIDAIAAAPGIEAIQLGVGQSNKPALALYRSVGFETYGVEKAAIKLDGRDIDEEMMVRFL
ncbi:MAG: GNAT family N-acetyltransferase [Planctomycetota bacterium]|jgi:ribosomal protein S18 acetylase RimI-like enzyme